MQDIKTNVCVEQHSHQFIHDDKEQIVDLLNFQMVFPFNVKNLNYKLFLHEQNLKHLTSNEEKVIKQAQSNPKRYVIFSKNNKFWKNGKLEQAINYIFTNIVNSTNMKLPIFDKFSNGSYIDMIEHASDAFNEDNISNFTYNININKKSSIYSVLKKFKLTLNVNRLSERVSGGFILDFNLHPSLAFEDTVDLIYLFNLFKENVNAQLLPLNMESVLDIISGNEVKITHSHGYDDKHEHYAKLTQLNSIVDFKYISINTLYKLWNNLLDEKYIYAHGHQFSNERIQYLKNDLFYALLLIMFLNVYVVSELNEIFTSTNSFSIFDINMLSANVQNDETNAPNNKDYFDRFVQMLHHNCLHHGSIFVNVNEENKKNKIIKGNPISLRDVKINYSLSSPSIVYNMKFIKFKNVVHFNELLKNDEYLAIFLMILFPNTFSLNMSDNKIFPKLDLIYDYMKYLKEMDKEKYRLEIKKCLCENTYYFYSFIKNDNVILLENNSYDVRSKLTLENISYYYLIGICFIQSRLNELKILEKIGNFVEFTNDIRWKNIPYHKLQRDLTDIDFDCDSINLFANQKLTSILNKMQSDYQLKEKITTEQDKIRWSDELFKRGIERSNFIIAFIVAILVGFINYFGQLYSETTDSNVVGVGYPGIDLYFPWIPMTISWASVAELSMIIILIYAFYRSIYFRVKLKLIDEHKIQLF